MDFCLEKRKSVFSYMLQEILNILQQNLFLPSVITSDHLGDNVKVFDNLFPVYIHMHMCITVHGGLHLCVSAHVKAKCQHFSSQTVHLIFLRQKLSLVRNLPSRMDCLATKLQFSVNFYFPTVEYASVYATLPNFFTWVLSTKLSFLCLYSQCVANCTISSAQS